MLINKLLPIIIFFFAGYALKKKGVFSSDQGTLLLRVVFYLCLPAISFATFSRIELSIERIYPLITAAFIILGNFAVTRLYASKLLGKSKSSSVIILSTIILNTSLILPFAQAKWGEEGTGNVLLFDIVHVTMVFTFSYWVAMRYGNERAGRVPVGKILRLPPLWGIFTGLLVNIAGIPVPEFIYEITAISSKSLVLLMMTALGLFFEFRVKHIKVVVVTLLQRSIGGLALGYIITWLLGVSGAERQILLLISAAPVGFNTLMLSDLEELDMELAAELVGMSTLMAVLILPVVLLLI